MKRIGIHPQPKKSKEQVEAEREVKSAVTFPIKCLNAQEFLAKVKHRRKRRSISCPPKGHRDPDFVAIEYTDAYNKWLSQQHLKGKCSKDFP